MTKLHEILAVEGDLDGVQQKIVTEAVVTFTKKPDHFIEINRRVEMFDEKRKNEETSESKAMVTTVADKLDYVMKSVVRYYDSLLQKEEANQRAKADIMIDGAVIAQDVPVQMLLNLESRLKSLRDMYSSIPTLAPGTHWVADPEKGKNVHRSRDSQERFKTEKTMKSIVLYEATDKHPAQIDKWNEDANIGKILTDTWSGMVTPAEKSELLERLDTLLRAVKKARQRANTTEVKKDLKIGNKIFNYIHKGAVG